MKKFTLFFLIAISGIALTATAQSSPDPGKPDLVLIDSVASAPGKAFMISIRLVVDDTTQHNDKTWVGIGSFCIPLKYDSRALKMDSVKFVGTLANWDEKFTNSKIDTGFISFAGIHNIGGPDNPALFSPGGPEEVIIMFGSVKEGATPGLYKFEITVDPLQKDMYLGSIDGMHGWKPKFIPGRILVTVK
jgi:hypothetical protein